MATRNENEQEGVVADPVVKKPAVEQPKAEPKLASGKKVRIKNASLAGQAVVVGDTTVNVGEDGIFEIPEDQAARLLTIAGYEKA